MFKGKPGIVYTDPETYHTARIGLIYVLQLLHIVSHCAQLVICVLIFICHYSDVTMFLFDCVNPLSCIVPYFIILLCLTPDYFTRQGESAGA
jgi:hypothetical protein